MCANAIQLEHKQQDSTATATAYSQIIAYCIQYGLHWCNWNRMKCFAKSDREKDRKKENRPNEKCNALAAPAVTQCLQFSFRTKRAIFEAKTKTHTHTHTHWERELNLKIDRESEKGTENTTAMLKPAFRNRIHFLVVFLFVCGLSKESKNPYSTSIATGAHSIHIVWCEWTWARPELNIKRTEMYMLIEKFTHKICALYLMARS